MQNSTRRPPTLGPSRQTWAIGPPLGSYETTSTIAIIITQPGSWYSFYHPAEGRRLSRPRWLVIYPDGLPATHPSSNRAQCRLTSLINCSPSLKCWWLAVCLAKLLMRIIWVSYWYLLLTCRLTAVGLDYNKSVFLLSKVLSCDYFVKPKIPEHNWSKYRVIHWTWNWRKAVAPWSGILSLTLQLIFLDFTLFPTLSLTFEPSLLNVIKFLQLADFFS